MSKPSLILTGVPRLQFLELQQELGCAVVQRKEPGSSPKLEGLSGEEVVIILLGYPVAKALARRIVRDRAWWQYKITRPDGTVEEGILSSTQTQQLSSTEDEIVADLTNRILGQSSDNAPG
jgi:hypothetical protein